MIHLYGLSYRLEEYIMDSIIDIYCEAGEDIHFTVIDNKSENSKSIRENLLYAKAMGFINRVVCMKGNSRGNALIDIVRLYPPDNSEDFFVITDLDLQLPCGLEWASKLRDCKKAGANIAGFDLSLKNYVPPNTGHDKAGIGWWLMMLDTKKFFELPKDVAYTDSFLIQQLGPLHRAKGELYHLTWDSWRDYPEYWEMKQKGIPWNTYETNEIEEIFE